MKLSKIAQMTDRAGLRNLMDNAKRLGRDDVYWAAFKRFCALEGIVHDDPLTRDFYNVLNAYEELLRRNTGAPPRRPGRDRNWPELAWSNV